MKDGMETVLVAGVPRGTGPGTLLGAIDGGTRVDADRIGSIDIHPGYALVAVPGDIQPNLATDLDGVVVNGGTVTAHLLTREEEETLEAVQAFAERYVELVELEREEEMEQHRTEIKHLSGEERQEKGRAVLQLSGRDDGDSVAGYQVTFTRQDNTPFPETEISIGDLVMVSKQDPLRDDNPTGTVTEKTNYSLTVAFPDKPSGFVFSRNLRLDLYVNDITYQRMKDALHTLPTLHGKREAVRNVAAGITPPTATTSAEITDWFNPGLNPAQKDAVRSAAAAEDVHLIHGPPGTGKTTTCAEIVEQAVANQETVLATAASNTAVDTMLEQVLAQGVDAVRVGHPARVTDTLHQHTLDKKVQEQDQYQEAETLRREAFRLKEQQDDLPYPSGRYRRGMSNQEIKDLAEEGKGARGVSPETIQGMAEYLELQEQIDELFAEADRLKDAAVNTVLAEADVICTTNSTAGSDLLHGKTFDLLVVDEATQATTPSCLIPMVNAEQVVMAGDHRQLPPTVKSYEAEEKGLGHTLFECIAANHDHAVSTLTKQYRMHKDIMEFSNQVFYETDLAADEAVATHTLTDLGAAPETGGTWEAVIDPETPIVFVDTATSDAEERSRADSPSTENPVEAQIAAAATEHVIGAGLPPRDVAVITPYTDQVDRIEHGLEHDRVEVDTVDGFQGREKEAVIISLVRSNNKQDIGFLQDVRRLNVALTRAKRKLIVIGDSTTVSTHPVYDAFTRYAAQHGHRITADTLPL